eukprot:TRINITY_DN8594_c0_g1_i1.p1 TRINITY_DN8594_c0_g1~~TRINITY_DN8594_c0_g1_i1.p1  ORF type:complete len:274 (+),score=28.42 TRINITY_DN8594_c0_g1_i1:1-822(+)
MKRNTNHPITNPNSSVAGGYQVLWYYRHGKSTYLHPFSPEQSRLIEQNYQDKAKDFDMPKKNHIWNVFPSAFMAHRKISSDYYDKSYHLKRYCPESLMTPYVLLVKEEVTSRADWSRAPYENKFLLENLGGGCVLFYFSVESRPDPRMAWCCFDDHDEVERLYQRFIVTRENQEYREFTLHFDEAKQKSFTTENTRKLFRVEFCWYWVDKGSIKPFGKENLRRIEDAYIHNTDVDIIEDGTSVRLDFKIMRRINQDGSSTSIIRSGPQFTRQT